MSTSLIAHGVGRLGVNQNHDDKASTMTDGNQFVPGKCIVYEYGVIRISALLKSTTISMFVNLG